jgi:hypothetical protein
MAKTRITNVNRWFDEGAAHKFPDAGRGDEWSHQQLYYTRSGAWVLRAWSQWEGSAETCELISQESAIEWLIEQEYHDPYDPDFAHVIDKLPGKVAEAVRKGVAAAEV